jgi:hypothetical protein
MEQEFSRLLKGSPHANKVTNERSLTAEDDALSKRFVYSVYWLLLLLFFVIKQSVYLFHESGEKLIGRRFLLFYPLQPFFFKLIDGIAELLIYYSLQTSFPRIRVVPSTMFVNFRAQNNFAVPIEVKNHLCNLKDRVQFLQTCLFLFKYDIEKGSQKQT